MYVSFYDFCSGVWTALIWVLCSTIQDFDSKQTTTNIYLKNFGEGIESWPCLVFVLWNPANRTAVFPDKVVITENSTG